MDRLKQANDLLALAYYLGVAAFLPKVLKLYLELSVAVSLILVGKRFAYED